MFTLVYINNQFNRPDTLVPFLKSIIGQSPLLRIDCVNPYHGTVDEIIREACDYLSSVCPQIEVIYNITQNVSTETNEDGNWVHFLVMQITVSER